MILRAALVSWVLMAAAPVDTSLPDSDPTALGHLAQTDQTTTRTAPVGTSRFEPAPMPDRDMAAPSATRSAEAGLQPTLFSKKQEFRGDGFSPDAPAQSAEERNRKPGLGFNFSMPVQ